MTISLRRLPVIYFFALIILCSFRSQAQIIYTDLNPDVKIEGWEVYQLKLDPGINMTMDIWKHPDEVVVNSLNSNFEVMVDNQGLPVALNSGTVIDVSAAWIKPSYTALWDGSTGNWNNVQSKYLGLRFKKDNVWHYGWARLEIDAAPSYFILSDYGYNSVADASLKAGEGAGTAGINDAQPQSSFITIYPNPCKGNFSIKSDRSIQNARVEIVNCQGQIVYTGISGQSFFSIEGLPKGIYLVRILDQAAILETKRVVVE